MMEKLLAWIGVFVIGILSWVLFVGWMFSVFAETGPGCPIDPEYLGFCSDLEV